MNDRFKFNAIVSSYYDIDTPEEYKEVEPQFYLKNVDVFNTGEIGIFYDKLLDEVRKQSPDLTEKEIGQIMQHFEDNSNSPECDFVTIKPDKILQSTGLKDKNGKLIFEGDVIKCSYGFEYYNGVVVWDKQYIQFSIKVDKELYSFNQRSKHDKIEVIDNIYADAHLLEEKEL